MLAFTDDLLKAGLSAIHNHPWIPTSGPDAIAVRGFIFDVDTGTLDEVSYPGPMGSFGKVVDTAPSGYADVEDELLEGLIWLKGLRDVCAYSEDGEVDICFWRNFAQ